MQIMKYVMYTCNVYILNHFYFPEAFLQVKKLMEKTYSETEQNMSEKQGKGQIMLHLPMKFENHVMNMENKKKLEWLNPSQIKSYMASFLTKPKTKSETSSSNLQVQFKEIPNEDVGQDETLSEVIAVLETNDYNSNIENIVEEVYTAVNM